MKKSLFLIMLISLFILQGTLRAESPGLVTVDFKGVDFTEAVSSIAKQVDIELVVSPLMKGKVTIKATGEYFEDVLRSIARNHGGEFYRDGRKYFISTQNELAKMPARQTFLQLKHITSFEAMDAGLPLIISKDASVRPVGNFSLLFSGPFSDYLKVIDTLSLIDRPRRPLDFTVEIRSVNSDGQEGPVYKVTVAALEGKSFTAKLENNLSGRIESTRIQDMTVSGAINIRGSNRVVYTLDISLTLLVNGMSVKRHYRGEASGTLGEELVLEEILDPVGTEAFQLVLKTTGATGN